MEENNTTATTPSNSGGSNSMSLIVGAIVLAGLLGYVIFSSRDMGKNENATTETSPVTEELTENNSEPESIQSDTFQDVQDATDEEGITTEIGDENAKVFLIKAGSFYFEPSSIIVKKGDTVRIELTAADMMHDFNIDELGVKVPLTQSGKTNSVEFVVNEAGSYEFYCSVGQHRQQGQVGTLIVQE